MNKVKKGLPSKSCLQIVPKIRYISVKTIENDRYKGRVKELTFIECLGLFRALYPYVHVPLKH